MPRKPPQSKSKPHGPRAPRFRAPDAALDYFRSEQGQSRPGRATELEEALLGTVGRAWASEKIPYAAVAAAVAGATVGEIDAAGRQLLRDGRVVLQGGRAYRADRSGFETSIPWTEVASSNVKAVGYCVLRQGKGILGVQFLSGTTYFYDTGRRACVEMLAAPSKGKYLHWKIKVKNVPYDGPYSL